jgi:hypothetical protein
MIVFLPVNVLIQPVLDAHRYRMRPWVRLRGGLVWGLQLAAGPADRIRPERVNPRPNWAVYAMSGLPPVASKQRKSRIGRSVPIPDARSMQLNVKGCRDRAAG